VELARSIATTIAAMEYDVRLRDAGSGRLMSDAGDDSGGPYVVEARAADWPELVDVLDEIIREQREFDAALDRWRDVGSKTMRVLLALAALAAMVLALFMLLGAGESAASGRRGASGRDRDDAGRVVVDRWRLRIGLPCAATGVESA
jgi:hypothetical protein